MKKNKNGNKLEFAEPGDPLVTRAGDVIEEDKEGVFRKVPEGSEEFNPAYYRPEEQKVLSDLPASPQSMNAIAVVLFYTLSGISDTEIAESIGIDIGQIRTIRMSGAYADAFGAVNNELIKANSVTIANRVANYSLDALDVVADIAFFGKKENNKLRAAVDLLNRNEKREEKRDPMNELKITITKGNTEDTSIRIDL